MGLEELHDRLAGELEAFLHHTLHTLMRPAVGWAAEPEGVWSQVCTVYKCLLIFDL